MENKQFSNVFIPPMPEALALVRQELAKPEPDMDRIAGHISRDMSLAGQVLQVVNSPGFGRAKKIASISAALMMLGFKNVLNITNGIAMRAMMDKHCKHPLDRFWDSAGDVASAAAVLAGELTGLPQEMAYAAGLMHDCGIPVLICNSERYTAFVSESNRSQSVADPTEAERQQFGLDHAVVGAYVAKKWHMPDEVVATIRYHHSFKRLADGSTGADESVIGLVGVIKMAEHIGHEFRGMLFRTTVHDPEWDSIGDAVLAYFGCSEKDFADQKSTLLELLSQR